MCMRSEVVLSNPPPAAPERRAKVSDADSVSPPGRFLPAVQRHVIGVASLGVANGLQVWLPQESVERRSRAYNACAEKKEQK